MTRVFRYAGASIAALGQNLAHTAAANNALSLYSSDAIYSFIPKNACSTLRYSLALANGAIEDESQFNWIHHNNNTFCASLGELARAKYTFVVVRDPFLRLASCFLDKIVDQTPVAASLNRLMGYGAPSHDVTFRAFVAGLKGYLRGDEHWRPQVDFLVYKTYDDVFRLEDFSAAVRVLKAKIGFEVRDARALTRHGTDQFAQVDEECVADVPAFDLLAAKRQGRVPRLQDFYDRALIAQVAALYAADLEFYRNETGGTPVF